MQEAKKLAQWKSGYWDPKHTRSHTLFQNWKNVPTSFSSSPFSNSESLNSLNLLLSWSESSSVNPKSSREFSVARRRGGGGVEAEVMSLVRLFLGLATIHQQANSHVYSPSISCANGSKNRALGILCPRAPVVTKRGHVYIKIGLFSESRANRNERLYLFRNGHIVSSQSQTKQLLANCDNLHA